MSNHIVEQPDGKYAMWSTEVDNFLEEDMSLEEVETLWRSLAQEMIDIQWEEVKSRLTDETMSPVMSYQECLVERERVLYPYLERIMEAAVGNPVDAFLATMGEEFPGAEIITHDTPSAETSDTYQENRVQVFSEDGLVTQVISDGLDRWNQDQESKEPVWGLPWA